MFSFSSFRIIFFIIIALFLLTCKIDNYKKNKFLRVIIIILGDLYYIAYCTVEALEKEISEVNIVLGIFIIGLTLLYIFKGKNSTNIKIEGKICPCCKNSEFELGKQIGIASIFSVKKPLTRGSHVTHVICTKCGYIVESYVEKPHNFR